MKRLPTITSVTTQIKFSESRLENYFNSTSQDTRAPGDSLSRDFENIDWVSVHAAAKGSIQLVFASDKSGVILCVDIPTTTCFLTTGIRTYNESYKLAFAVSMS